MTIQIDTIQCWARWQSHVSLARRLLSWVDYEPYQIYGSPCVRILIDWSHQKQTKFVLMNTSNLELPTMVLHQLDSICHQHNINISSWSGVCRTIHNPYVAEIRTPQVDLVTASPL